MPPAVIAAVAGGVAAAGASKLMQGSSKGKGGGTDIQAAGQQAYDRSQMTSQEQAQYSGSFDIGQFLQQILQSQMGVGQAPQGYQSPEQQFQQGGQLNQALYGQTLQDIQNPEQAYISTLQPALQQAQETINQYYQKRGLLNSGLAIESMGRAGVDLAIQEAQGRMAARQQSMQNAFGLSQNIDTGAQNRFANLASLYGSQQGFGQQAMARQAQAAQTAAGFQAYPAQAALGSYYGGQAAGQALPGQLIGAAGTALGGYLSRTPTPKTPTTQG